MRGPQVDFATSRPASNLPLSLHSTPVSTCREGPRLVQYWCGICTRSRSEGPAMSDGSYLSWEEVQRLMLPPNATMLVPPPPPAPVEVPALAAGPPPKPDWLDDG